MRFKAPYYEVDAYPDGRVEVRYIYRGGAQASTLCSRVVKPEELGMGTSLLEGAEGEARSVIAEDRAERAQAARLRDGRVSFRVKA